MIAHLDGALPTIYSAWVCPYAQRTRTLLELKGIAHRAVEIDLTQPRPEWFVALNPSGKVPVLVHGGQALNESSVINEYLDEVFPQIPAMPAAPFRRAQARLLVRFCDERFAPNMYRVLMAQDDARRARAIEAATFDWTELEAMLERIAVGDDTVFGEFGMAEITYAPFFQRYVLTDYYRGFRPWEADGLARVRCWRNALLTHPTAIATGMSDADYIKLYEDYAYGYANGRLRPGAARSSLDLSIAPASRPMPESAHAFAWLEARSRAAVLSEGSGAAAP